MVIELPMKEIMNMRNQQDEIDKEFMLHYK